MAPFLLVTKSSPPLGGGLRKTVKAYYRRVLYRAWGLTAHRGWARLMLDRRSLVQAPGAPRDQSQHPHARNDYDEEAAYESYMNPEPGFQYS